MGAYKSERQEKKNPNANKAGLKKKEPKGHTSRDDEETVRKERRENEQKKIHVER